MDLTQRLKSRLADYSSDEFIVDEHAMKRCRDYHNPGQFHDWTAGPRR